MVLRNYHSHLIEFKSHSPLHLNKGELLIISNQTRNNRVNARKYINSFNVYLIEFLVIDDANLFFSFGYEQEMKSLVNHLSKNRKTIIFSTIKLHSALLDLVLLQVIS